MSTVTLAETIAADAKIWLVSYGGGALGGTPTGWAGIAYDDSGWEAASGEHMTGFFENVPFDRIFPAEAEANTYLQNLIWLARIPFTLADLPTSAVLYRGNDDTATYYLNGTLVHSATFDLHNGTAHAIDPSLFVVGDNVFAIRVTNNTDPGSNWDTNPTYVLGRLVGEYPDPVTPQGWDVFASDDLNGPIIATLETARGRYVRDELNALGEGGFSINRHSAEATEAIIKQGNLVRPHIPECGDGYLPGFFIGPDGDYTVASQKASKGGELLTVKGPGLLSYLDRARMTECAYSIEGTIVDTWSELWHAKNVPNPAGIFYDPDDPTILRIISETTRRVYTVRQADRVVTAVTAPLFTHYAGGLSGIPGDAAHYLALEAPWLGSSGAHSFIHKIVKATGAIVASYDIGTDHWTSLKSDGTNIYLTNYSDDKIYKKTMTGGAVSNTHITYNGVIQTKPTGVSINGTEIDYWFSGTKRMLRASTAAYATITGVVSTQAITAFGGEWDTTTGTHLYMDSVALDEYWKFQLAIAVPACADSSGIFHPEQTSPGALAARVLAEITHVDRPDHPVPDLTYDFDFTTDSDGNAWPARTSTEEFTWRVGDRAFTDVLARLIPGGVTFRMDPDAMVLHAYVTSLFGVDRTSGTFGGGKIRFVIGDGTAGLGNINSDLRRRDNRGAPDTYMTVAGDNGSYGHASVSEDYIQEGFLQVTGTTDTGILDSIATDELARQRLASDAIGFEALWGDDDTAGLYLPYKHYSPGDLARVHTGTGEWDFNETDWRVYAILLTERDGGFRHSVEAGSAYKVPPPTSTVAGTTTVGSGSGAGSSGGGTSTGGITSIKATDNAGGSAVGTELTSDDWIVYQPGPGVIKIRISASAIPLVEDMLTTETDTSKVLQPDGAGGVQFDVLEAAEVTFDDSVALLGATNVQDAIEILDASIDTITAGLGLPWFIVTDAVYGATGDGSTDDRTALNSAHAAYNAAGGGCLYYPRGNYKTSGALTALTAPGIVLGDGMGTSAYATRVFCTSPTAVVFTSASDGISYRGIAGANTAGSTPSAGAFILASAGIQARYENLSIVGFYDNLDLATGNVWAVTGCDIEHPVRYGIRVRNSTSADAGDWMISDCVFTAFTSGSDAAIRLESAGGGKVINCKVNGGGGSDRFTDCINIAPSGTTTILLIANCSFENYSRDGIRYRTGGPTWNHISVIGCQFGQYANTSGSIVDIDGASDILVTHCVLRVTGGGSPVAVKLANGSRAVVGPFTNDGFTTLLQTTSFTNVDDRTTVTSATYAAPAWTFSTSAAAGSAPTGVRSDATIALFDASAPAAIGTAATGSAGLPPRRDHVHPTGAGTPSTSAIGDAAATGTGPAAAMTDHVHGREALSTATPLVESGAGATGTATKSSREDHVHPAAATTTSGADDHIHIVGERYVSDGATLTYTLAQEAIPNTVGAYLAGLRKTVTLGGMNDQITLPAAGVAGDEILVDYIPLQA